MESASKNFSKEELNLLLEKGTAPGWWNKEVHKISFKIVSELIMFSSKIFRKIALGELYLVWIIILC